jgi:hypothetical protein
MRCPSIDGITGDPPVVAFGEITRSETSYLSFAKRNYRQQGMSRIRPVERARAALGGFFIYVYEHIMNGMLHILFRELTAERDTFAVAAIVPSVLLHAPSIRH